MSQMLSWSNISSPLAVWLMVFFVIVFMGILIYAAIMKKDQVHDLSGKALDEQDLLLEHEYDGIKELDNALPPWWKNLFYVSLIFGVIYMLIYHTFQVWNLPEAEYVKELKEAGLFQDTTAPESPSNAKPVLSETEQKESMLKAGKQVFMVNCVACHAPDGGGAVGPNLCDEYWIHGNTKAEIIHIINEGVLEKGMISWKTMLSADRIEQVAEYIMSLQGTTPANPKEPQGIKVDKS